MTVNLSPEAFWLVAAFLIIELAKLIFRVRTFSFSRDVKERSLDFAQRNIERLEREEGEQWPRSKTRING